MKTQPKSVAPVAESPIQDTLTVTPTTFADLGLAPAVLGVLEQLGFVTPTPIQLAAIPPLIAGRDVVGRARTGTGKTAAFGLPLLTRLSERASGKPRGLILAPTRELALQVAEALKSFAHRPLRLVTVYGGSPYGPQLRALRDGVEVVVGTPGRIIDLMERQALDLSELEQLVLDEADEMLKMGFIDDVERILGETPDTRQVALFSATMPEPIRRVAQKWLRNPVEANDQSAQKGNAVDAIEQLYVQVPARNKREALLRILHGEPRTAALIFAATKLECDEVTNMLQREGFAAEALHGDLSQPARERVVAQLRDRRLDLVVATDIAARGIDIDHLDLIVNLDLPKNVEVYTHRIGRTGRAGRKGRAITFVVPRESYPFVQAIQRMGVKVVELFLPSEKELVERRRAALVADAKSWLADGGEAAEVAREWVGKLLDEVASGESQDENGDNGETGETGETGDETRELLAALLGKLALESGVSLSRRLDAGVPPWARQPGVLKPKAVPAAKAAAAASPATKAHEPVREAPAKASPKAAASAKAPREYVAREPEVVEAPTERTAPTAPSREPKVEAASSPTAARPAAGPRRSGPERASDTASPVPAAVLAVREQAAAAPRAEKKYDAGAKKKTARAVPQAPAMPSGPGDSWIVVGVGRNDGVRPSDLVGALANELGIPGASIGRIELRDASALVQVADDFAERLGDQSWPLQVRRIDTEVRRHHHQAPTRAQRQPPERPTRGGPRAYAERAYEPSRAPRQAPRGEARYAPRADSRTESRPAAKSGYGERPHKSGPPAKQGGERPPRRPRT